MNSPTTSKNTVGRRFSQVGAVVHSVFVAACEETFGLVDESIHERMVFGALLYGLEFRKKILLFVGEVCWNFDKNLYMLISALTTAERRHSLALDAQDRSVLGSFGDLEFCLAGDCRNFNNPAKGGRHKINRQFTDDIESVAVENFVGTDMYDDVEIAGLSAADTAFTLS